jgi:hypothetical protein
MENIEQYKIVCLSQICVIYYFLLVDGKGFEFRDKQFLCMNLHCGTSQLNKVEIDETSKLNVANQALLAFQKVLQIERDGKRCHEAENIHAGCFQIVLNGRITTSTYATE